MHRWLLSIFRVAAIAGALAWAITAGDLSQQARGFVETRLAGWNQSIAH